MTPKVLLPIQVSPGVSPLLECLCGVAVVGLLVGHRNPGSPCGVGPWGVGHPWGRIVEPPSRLFPWHDWQWPRELLTLHHLLLKTTLHNVFSYYPRSHLRNTLIFPQNCRFNKKDDFLCSTAIKVWLDLLHTASKHTASKFSPSNIARSTYDTLNQRIKIPFIKFSLTLSLCVPLQAMYFYSFFLPNSMKIDENHRTSLLKLGVLDLTYVCDWKKKWAKQFVSNHETLKMKWKNM